MSKKCLPIIPLSNGQSIDLNQYIKTKEDFREFALKNKEFANFINRQLKIEESIEKDLYARNNHNAGENFLDESIKNRNFQERKNKAPIYVHTLDKMFYSAKDELKHIEYDDYNLQAPTIALQKEGMDFVNSPQFKVGTPVFYAFSNSLPYNRKIIPINEHLENGRLSAIVFTDKGNNPLPLEYVQRNFSMISKLAEKGEVKMKWVGALYEYNTPNYKKIADSLSPQSNNIKINQERAQNYKRELFKSKEISWPEGYYLQMLPNIYEKVHEVIGFNPNMDFEQGEDGLIKEIRKPVTKLNYIQGLPKIGVFTGYVKDSVGHPTHLQIPALNRVLSMTDSELSGFTRQDNLTGRLVLMVPTNVSKNIEGHYPLRVVTKALNYDAKGDEESDASVAILTKVRSLMQKVLSGTIQYELYDINSNRPSFVPDSIVDNTIVKYKTIISKDPDLRQTLVDQFKYDNIGGARTISTLYNEFKKESPVDTDYAFEEFLEQKNPAIPGDNKYISIVGNALIPFEASLAETLGLEVVNSSGLFTILAQWKKLANDRVDMTQAWPQFLNSWGAAGKPIQILATELNNPIYWKKWIKRYGLIKTGLNINRPTHSVSYYTSPDKVLEPKFNNPFESLKESPFEEDSLNDIVYSSTFDKDILSKEEITAWVNTNFPNFKKYGFSEFLINGLHNGSYDKVNDLIKFSEQYASLGVIREEFGHMVFEKLPEIDKKNLLAQAKKERPDLLIDNDLEEYIMAKLRNSPEKIMPKSYMKQFLMKLQEMLDNIFKKKATIESFIEKFNSGFYKKIKDNEQNSPNIHEASSIRTQKLSKKSLSLYVNLINKYYMQKLLQGTDLVKLLDQTQNIFNTNINGALQFIYKDTITHYIQMEQDSLLEDLSVRYPRFNKHIDNVKAKELLDTVIDPSDKYKVTTYAYLNTVRNLLSEPLFQSALYKNLSDTYNIKISGVEIYDEKDELGIVKAKDIKIENEVSAALKFLISTIPDIKEIDNTLFKADIDKLSVTGDNIAAQTPVEKIPGVVYEHLLLSEGITADNDSKFLSYDFRVKDRIDYLSKLLTNSLTPKDMMLKLNDVYKFGEDWARIFAFKIMEEYDILKDESPLMRDLWRGIGQKYFVPHIATYNQGNQVRTQSLNIVSTKNQLVRSYEKSIRQFGFDINEKADSNENAIKNYEELKSIAIKLTQGLTKTKENQLLIRGFSLLGISISKNDIKNIYGYQNRSSLKSTLGNLASIAFIGQGNNSIFVNRGYNDLETKEKVTIYINQLAELLSKNQQKSRVSSFNDMEKKQRSSHTKPNMIFAHLARLFRDKNYAEHIRKYAGFSNNPLLKAFQVNQDNRPQDRFDYDIAVYMGDKESGLNFEKQTNTQRAINALNIAAQNAKGKKPWGYFSLGNFGDSPTNYNIKAPWLSSTMIIDNFLDLIKGEIATLTSGVDEFDQQFADNKNKGIYSFDVNHLVKGDLEWTPSNRIALFTNFEANKEAIRNKVKEDLKQRAKVYINKLSNADKTLANKLHSHYIDRIDYGEALGGEIEEISKANMALYYYNTSYYQAATNQLFISHPYYFKNSTNFAKRAKLLHTSGDAIYDNLIDLDKPIMHPYILLADKILPTSQEVLDLIEEQALSYNKKAAKKDYSENNSTDSGAYMSIDMIKLRQNEGKGWPYYDEEYYKAQKALDIEKILLYENKVSWAPIKNGAYSLRPEITSFGESVIVPTIQKYSFQLLLPSEAYVTKDNRLINPKELLDKFKTIEEVFAQYKNQDLAKIVYNNFEQGVHFAYYESGAKTGKVNAYDPSKNIDAVVRQIPASDIREITAQPNKNDTKSRTVGIQVRMIAFGMIDDAQIYNINGYGEMNGAKLKELYMDVYAKDIESRLNKISFISKNAIGVSVVNKVELSNYLTEYILEKDYADIEDIKTFEIDPITKDFVLPLSLGNSPGMAMGIINSALDKPLSPEVNAPAYKNIVRTTELKSTVIEENGVKGLLKEAKVNMWPELARYYNRKLKENGVATDNFKGQLLIKNQIIDEINNVGFKMNIYRIPTEYAYSFIKLKLVELGPASLGHGIELPDDWTTQTGGDYDGDSMFTLMSSLAFNEEGISLIAPGLDSKGARQSLMTEIQDKVILANAALQLVSAENNVINRIAEDINDKDLKIGTIEANEEAQFNNDLGDSVIGSCAVTNSSMWFLNGLKNLVTINVAKGFPALDKEYDSNLLNTEVEGDLTKMAQSNTMVAAAVNMPSDLTFSKLGFDKKTVNVLDYMTSVMTVPMEYAVKFLRSPIISQYRKEYESLGNSNNNPAFFVELKALKKKYLGNINYDQALEEIISEAELENANPKVILAKYMHLSTLSGDFVKLTLALGKITKAGDGSPEKLFALFEDLKELPKYFPGIENVLPEIVLETKTGYPIYKMKHPSVASQLNSNYQVLLAKINVAKESSFFFHEKFIQLFNFLKGNVYDFKADKAVELEDFFSRYLLSKNNKSLAEYLYLGKEYVSEDQNQKLLDNGQYSYEYIQRKLFSQLGNESTLANIEEMLFTLRNLEIGKEMVNYRDTDNSVKRVGILKMANSLYDAESINLFNKGFLAMLKSEDTEVSSFAKDLRDFSIFTGWSKENKNYGGFVPREAWLHENKNYQDILNKNYVNLQAGNLLQSLVVFNPSVYSTRINNWALNVDGKKLWPFEKAVAGAPMQYTGEEVVRTWQDRGETKSYIKRFAFHTERTISKEYLDHTEKAAPLYFHMKEGNMLGVYKKIANSNNYKLYSLNPDNKLLDSDVESSLALTLDDIPINTEEIAKVVPNPYVEDMNKEKSINTIKNVFASITNHSGGAIGADSMFDKIGKEFGQTQHKHYYYGNKPSLGNQLLTKTEVEEGIKKMQEAAKILDKNPKKETTIHLLARNWFQVKNSTQIIAIAPINESMKFVEGGTGWAVAMAQTTNKEINVFNLKDNNWYKWDGNTFILSEVPILQTNFAGIGSRQDLGKMTSESIQAIKDVYIKTSQVLSEKINIDSNVPTLESRIEKGIELAQTQLPKYGLSEQEVNEWIEKLKAINTHEELNNIANELASKCK